MKKDHVLAFLAFFTIFAVVGFFEAKAKKQTSDYSLQYIVEHSKIIDESGRCSVVYEASGRPIWSLDISTNQGTFNNPFVHLRPQLAEQEVSMPVNPGVVRDFFGSALGAWTVKDVLEAVEKGPAKTKRVAAAILGSICGYNLGFWIGHLQDPPQLSSHIVSVLSEPGNFRTIKALTFYMVYQAKAGKGVNRTPSGVRDRSETAPEVMLSPLELALRQQDFRQILDRTRNPSYDLTNSDFSLLRTFY